MSSGIVCVQINAPMRAIGDLTPDAVSTRRHCFVPTQTSELVDKLKRMVLDCMCLYMDAPRCIVMSPMDYLHARQAGIEALKDYEGFRRANSSACQLEWSSEKLFYRSPGGRVELYAHASQEWTYGLPLRGTFEVAGKS